MLPTQGRGAGELLAELALLRAYDAVPVPVKSPGREAAERAYLAMLDADDLDPSVIALERIVIAAVASELGGDASTAGVITAGGTESIMLALRAARDAHAHVARPRVAVPVTAHGAFRTAAACLGLAVDLVPVAATTCRPSAGDLAAAVTRDTVLVGVSAPAAGHGVVDPVPAAARVAAARGIACHVDASAGWSLAWMPDSEPFDLSVPGVTSISCDLHEFGDVPRAVSVLLFADPPPRRAGPLTSRGAGPLAGAWAALEAMGADGHRRLGRRTQRALVAFLDAVRDLPGLDVLGRPRGPIVSLAATRADLDLEAVGDGARRRGLPVRAQAAVGELPPSLRLGLSRIADYEVPGLLAALEEVVHGVSRAG